MVIAQESAQSLAAAQVFGTALYSAKALLSGRGGDVLELLTDNFLN